MVLKSSTALYAERVKKELGDLITKSIYNLFARCVVKSTAMELAARTNGGHILSTT